LPRGPCCRVSRDPASRTILDCRNAPPVSVERSERVGHAGVGVVGSMRDHVNRRASVSNGTGSGSGSGSGSDRPGGNGRTTVRRCLHRDRCRSNGLRLAASRGELARSRTTRVAPALKFRRAVPRRRTGSGAFVTGPVTGFPPPSSDDDEAGATAPRRAAPSRAGSLHNLCAVPIFVGIPLASMFSAASSARRREYGWAGYSFASSLVMVASSVLFGAAFGGTPRLVARGGIFQRISIAAGFGWVSALSLRALSSFRRR